MKKAQISGQVFIYILAIIIFALTILYGYRAIAFFQGQSDEISLVQMQQDIKADVAKVKADTFGTIVRKELAIPGSYKQVCFVDSQSVCDNPDIYVSYCRELRDFPYDLIKDAIDPTIPGSTDSNMFLYPPGDVSYNVGDIQVDKSFPQCINVRGGRVTLKLESMGDHVKIAPWQES